MFVSLRLWDRNVKNTWRGKSYVLIMTDGSPSYLGHFPTSIGYLTSVWDLLDTTTTRSCPVIFITIIPEIIIIRMSLELKYF